MEEDKVVLDRRSFEALAVDTRIKILKSLKERRKTLSEIAKEQEMSVSGIKEHLETLEDVGLIRKIDDGHKWKYYELTKKGSEIVAPKELRVWILLSISVIALAASMLAIFSPPALMMQGAGVASAPALQAAEMNTDNRAAAPSAIAPTAAAPPSPAPSGNESAPKAFAATATDASAAGAALPSEAPGEAPQQPDLSVPIAVGIVSGITLLGCLVILARNRMKPTSL